MPPTVKQQAKSMAQNQLQNNEYLQYSDAYSRAMNNDAWNKMTQLDDKQWVRSQQVAERSAQLTQQENARDRANRESLAYIQGNSQIGVAQQNTRASIMEQERLNKQFDIQRNASMGLDAAGNVQGRPIGDYNGDGRGGDLKAAGGGSIIVGRGAFTSPSVMADPYGMSGMKANFQGIKDYNDRQNMAAMSEMQFGAIAARNKGLEAKEISMAQLDADKHRHILNVDMMNRQASLDAQKDAANRYAASAEARAERESRERMSLWNSISGSINGGGLGFQYWGGRV